MMMNSTEDHSQVRKKRKVGKRVSVKMNSEAVKKYSVYCGDIIGLHEGALHQTNPNKAAIDRAKKSAEGYQKKLDAWLIAKHAEKRGRAQPTLKALTKRADKVEKSFNMETYQTLRNNNPHLGSFKVTAV